MFRRSLVLFKFIGRRPDKRLSYDKEFTEITPWVTYMERKKVKLRAARASARKSQVRARKLEEAKGILLDVKKQFRMEVKRNTHIGKHLEMHERGKGPPIDSHMRETVSRIMQIVKKSR